MAVAIINTDFPEGFGADLYDAVNTEMGIEGDLPPGLIFHWAGDVDGKFTITDIWESREAYDTLQHRAADAGDRKGRRRRGRADRRRTADDRSRGPQPLQVVGRRQAIRFGGSRPSRTASTESATRFAIASRAVTVAEPTWGRRTQFGAASNAAGTCGSFS